MHTTASDWRKALATALKSTLHIDCDTEDAAFALAALSDRTLLALDNSIRRDLWSAQLPDFAWSLRAQPSDEEIDAQLFCVGCHADGRMRERALRLMQERRGRLAATLSLIRCDDWVLQVRLSAEDALRQIIGAEPTVLYAHLDLLVILRARLRIQTGVWRSLIDPVLLAPEHAAARWAALDGSHRPLFVCDLILRADPSKIEALALRTVLHRDPVVAVWGLRELVPVLDETVRDDLVARALRHASASVRAHALRASAGIDDYRVVVQKHLFDPSASVRGVAAYAMRALGLDPREAWRDAIDRGIEPQNRYALLALSDCSDAGDIDRISPWLRHTAGEVRCAALRAALRAGLDDPGAHLRDALRSHSGKVVALALKLGVTVSGFMTRETLANAFIAAANPITRQRIIDATRQLSRWDAIDCLLDAIEHDANGVDALSGLSAWTREIGQRYAPLSSDRKQALMQRIDEMAPRYPRIDWAALTHAVRTS